MLKTAEAHQSEIFDRNATASAGTDGFGLERKFHIFSNGSPIQQPRLLEYKSNFRFSLNQNISRSVLIQSCDEIEDRRFAASRRSKNGIERSIRDCKADPVEHAQERAAW